MPVDHLLQLHPSVSRHPGPTLFSVITSALGTSAHGMPPAWRRAVRESAPLPAAGALRTLLTTGRPWMPDCLSLTRNMHSGHSTSITDELDSIEVDTLVAEVQHQFTGAVPDMWRQVVDRPRQFLTAYRDLTHAVWDAFSPLWRQADGLMAREVERVGVASVTGVMGPVLSGLGPHVRYADGRLHLPDTYCGPSADHGQRRLVLAPLASGLTACAYSTEDAALVWIGYPLPGLGRLVHRAGPPEPRDGKDRLELLLGPVRAAIMRHAHRRPSVSQAAQFAHVTVSTATYHCGQLTRAGLLQRLRHGREVRLHLTAEGTALLDLLA